VGAIFQLATPPAVLTAEYDAVAAARGRSPWASDRSSSSREQPLPKLSTVGMSETSGASKVFSLNSEGTPRGDSLAVSCRRRSVAKTLAACFAASAIGLPGFSTQLIRSAVPFSTTQQTEVSREKRHAVVGKRRLQLGNWMHHGGGRFDIIGGERVQAARKRTILSKDSLVVSAAAERPNVDGCTNALAI
jgi:hypothetical protein